MPDPNVFEAIDAGDIDIEIGGCIISEEEPRRSRRYLARM
jgi:hypothetical protein